MDSSESVDKINESHLGAKGTSNVHQINIKKLIEAQLLYAGDQVKFKNMRGYFDANGNIIYEDKVFTSLSKWAKYIASGLGLTKQYNGWEVVTLLRTGRQLCQYRDKYLSNHIRVPYTFSFEKKRVRSESSPSWYFSHVKKRRNRRGGDKDYSESEEGSGNSIKDEIDRILNKKIDFRSSVVLPCDSECYACHKINSSNDSFSPTWANILGIALYSLGLMNPKKEYFSLGEDIYPFIDRHWHIICNKKVHNDVWRQTAKMTLAHSRYYDLFENGYDQLYKTGFWRLKGFVHPSKYKPADSSNENSSVPDPSIDILESKNNKEIFESIMSNRQESETNSQNSQVFNTENSGSNFRKRLINNGKMEKDSKITNVLNLDSSILKNENFAYKPSFIEHEFNNTFENNDLGMLYQLTEICEEASKFRDLENSKKN